MKLIKEFIDETKEKIINLQSTELYFITNACNLSCCEYDFQLIDCVKVENEKEKFFLREYSLKNKYYDIKDQYLMILYLLDKISAVYQDVNLVKFEYNRENDTFYFLVYFKNKGK